MAWQVAGVRAVRRGAYTVWMTLIADLHGRIVPVRQDSYLVLLAGDVGPDKGAEEWLTGPFKQWLEKLPCPVVAVKGNHDYWGSVTLPWTLLEHGQHCQVAGKTIWANAVTICDQDPEPCEHEIAAGLAAMPIGVDILLSHVPPAGILDTPSVAKHLGSFALAHIIWTKRPRLCVFGHVHEARGHCRRFGTYCVNATLGSGCDRSGCPVPARHTPWGLADNSWM